MNFWTLDFGLWFVLAAAIIPAPMPIKKAAPAVRRGCRAYLPKS